jgi:arylsulfatase A-like enzyme
MQDYAPDFETNASAYPIEEMPRRIRKRADFGPRLAPYTRPLYWSEINFVDEQFHRLARRMGIAEDDVLLVVTSDHGEEFLERGELGHGHSLYEELVRVPLLVHWPARFSNAVRVEQEVSLLDVYPTLSTLAGLPNPPRTQGSDLVPQLTNSGTVESRTLVLQLKKGQSDLRAVVQGPWKLIEDQKSGRNALFHLPSDPAEERDVADANPEVTERLRESARSWAADLPPPPDDLRRQTMPDEAMQERLRALGYLPDKDDD